MRNNDHKGRAQPVSQRPHSRSIAVGRSAHQHLAPLLIALLSLLMVALAFGQDGAPLAVDERADRERDTMEARSFADEGDLLMRDGDYEEAAKRFGQSLEVLPKAPITEELRQQIITRYSRAALTYAETLIKQARYPEARALVDSVLADDVAPNDFKARKLAEALEDPDAVNLADSPESQEKVAKIISLLKQAESAELLDDYDLSTNYYNEVLRLDNYNKAAQKGLERLARKKTDYYGVAANRTRSEMLSEVAAGWETPRIQVYSKDAIASGAQLSPEEVLLRNTLGGVREKLSGMVVDRVSLEDATVFEALQFLAIKSQQLDPDGQGVNFVVRGNDGKEASDVNSENNVATGRINLELSNLPIIEIVGYIARQAGMRYRIEQYAVVLAPSGLESDLMVTRSYRVPPDFISAVPADGGGGGGDDPFASAVSDTGGLQLKRLSAEEFLQQSGIPFPEGSFANFDRRTSRLILRNTNAAHQQVESLIEMTRTDGSLQVEIRLKVVEVNQTKLYELGFDWLLGAANLGNGIVGVGGTGSTVGNPAATPLTDPTSTGSVPLGANPVTESLRSGQLAVTTPGLDSLIAAGSPAATATSVTRAPAAFGIAGVLTEPQFQMVMRGFNQNKATDSLVAPTVVTRSGQVARIEAIREFIYPTEYDPPELPNAVGDSGGLGGFPVTPATPTAFETKPLGTILDVDPVVSQDGKLIELNIDAVFREFIGFVNYGTPITSGPLETLTGTESVILTENQILQPIFETRRQKTSVSVYDGQTLVIGGLIQGQRETVEDSVPILGDIPILGRLFRSDVDSHTRNAIMMFVEVNVLDPSGNPLRDYRGNESESVALSAPAE